MARTGSDRPTIVTIEGSVVFLACIASWLRAPNSILMANSSAFSGSNVTFKSSFWISGSIMLAVKMSRNKSSSNAPSWQNSARDRKAEWNCSMVSPFCCRLVSSKYRSKVTFRGRMNVSFSSSHSCCVVMFPTLEWGYFLVCILRPSIPMVS